MTTVSHLPDHAEVTGRIGLVARGVVYCVAGVIAFTVATGRGGGEIEGSGAIEALAARSYGSVLLVALVVGLVAYAVWRVLRAVTGAHEGARREPWQHAVARVGNLAQALVYAGLALAAVRVLARGGRGGSDQDQQARSLSARLLEQGWGRAAVMLLGGALIAAGAGMVWWGLARRFEEHLRTGDLDGWERRWLPRLGMLGHTARGVVAALVGLFLIQAAVDHDPSQAVGVDGALRRLAGQPHGPAALAVVAVGLVAYGLHSFVEARWRKVLE